MIIRNISFILIGIICSCNGSMQQSDYEVMLQSRLKRTFSILCSIEPAFTHSQEITDKNSMVFIAADGSLGYTIVLRRIDDRIFGVFHEIDEDNLYWNTKQGGEDKLSLKDLASKLIQNNGKKSLKSLMNCLKKVV